jgi:phytanoyl-CoA hydroxylase
VAVSNLDEANFGLLFVNRKRFQDICERKVNAKNMTIMRDVAILKSEFKDGEKAVTKIQNFCDDDVMFEYCCLPEVD